MRDFSNAPYAEKLSAGQKVALSDSSTKVVFITAEEGYEIKIDHGMYELKGNGVEKCDFGITENALVMNLIELKGTNIERAYEQLLQTVTRMKQDSTVESKDIFRAFIVSPLRRKIPRNIDSLERKLGKAMMAGKKVEGTIYDNIWKVTVRPAGRTTIDSANREIICDNKQGIDLGDCKH